MYLLKHCPEDFLVTEISVIAPEEDGPYLYYRLVKKNWNTLDAVGRIAQLLHLPHKNIGFAGSKDRVAITEQVISVRGAARQTVEGLEIKRIELHFLGRGEQPISLGDLQGNHFVITVRNLEPEALERNLQPIQHFPNYFDEQRFGQNNLEIGRALLRKDFASAAKLISQQPYRKFMEKHHLHPLPPTLSNFYQSGSSHPNDHVGALKRLPLRFLRLLLNAYQSWLWNEALALYLSDHGVKWKEVPYSVGRLVFVKNPEDFRELKIPLIGFGSRELEGESRDIIRHLMAKEGITYEDFIIRQIPELSQEGELRDAMAVVKDFNCSSLKDDEFHPGKKKMVLSFTLPKGSYATMLIKYLLG